MIEPLLRNLHYELTQQIPIGKLRELGWFDFRSFDHPDTDDPVLLAYDALMYLTVDNETKKWNGIWQVVAACISFLQDQTGILSNSSELEQLRVLLSADCIFEERVSAWFDQVYRNP